MGICATVKTNCGYRLRESRVILYPGKSQRSVTVSSWLDSGVDMDFEFWRKKKCPETKIRGLRLFGVTLRETTHCQDCGFQTTLTSWKSGLWYLNLILTLVPDGSVAAHSVMLPPFLILLPGLAHAGLLGAGTGLGSCAAPPFRFP